MTIKKRFYRLICTSMILCLVLTSFSTESVFAVMKEVGNPASVTKFSSTDTLTDDYLRAEVNGKEMTLKYKTMIPSCEFRVAFYGVHPKTGVHNPGIYIPAEPAGVSQTGNTVYGFEYTLDFSQIKLPDGEYFLYLSSKKDMWDQYESAPSSGALYKNMVFRIKKNTPTILKYNDVIDENRRVQAIGADYDPAWYLDETLDDIRFTLRNPATNVYDTMSSYKISFMRRMSDQITAGAVNDYDKLLKLYEYVTSEFYYDSVAFSTHSYQYANPYENLYNHVNRIPSANSDNQGRVATTCQGYSAIFLSMARAQGIPTRFVYGHRATSPLYNWATEPNISSRDHWWVESYVNGRWIFIDPTIGTNNKWNSSTDTWQYYGLTNYTYFDPSDEQIAVSHIYHNIYPDKRFGYLITNQAEINKLQAFLDTKTNGIRHGAMMNSSYNPYDLTTWGDGVKSHFLGDGYGNTTTLQWSYKGFAGALDLSDMKKLKTLSMHHNEFSEADLSNCTNLENVYLYNNNLKSIDLSNCKNLKLASVTTDNALKEAQIYANKKNIYISSGNHGAFQIKYDASKKSKLEVRFKPDIGYTVSGFYNGSGDRVSTSLSYSMNPGWRDYEVLFKLDPNSYTYYLYNGRNQSSVKPYTEASQKRLIALGYMDGEPDGIFDDKMEEIVKTFQTVHGLADIDGTIGEKTWSALFNKDAIECPSDEVIEKIKTARGQTLTVDTEVSKGKVVLTWENANPEASPVGGYQVWKSTAKDTGYKKIGSTKNLKFTNKSGLKKKTRYYYKVRTYTKVNGKIYYGQWTQVNVKAK